MRDIILVGISAVISGLVTFTFSQIIFGHRLTRLETASGLRLDNIERHLARVDRHLEDMDRTIRRLVGRRGQLMDDLPHEQ